MVECMTGLDRRVLPDALGALDVAVDGHRHEEGLRGRGSGGPALSRHADPLAEGLDPRAGPVAADADEHLDAPGQDGGRCRVLRMGGGNFTEILPKILQSFETKLGGISVRI